MMKIYNSKNIIELKELSVLDNGSYYIYCMLNSIGNIKIGITTDIVQRLQSLSGSNAAGYKITTLALSSPTYVFSAEKAFHNKYARYRLEGEWFDGNKVTFDEIINEMEDQFNTESYKLCNEIRKELAEKKMREDEEKRILEEKEKEEQLLKQEVISSTKKKTSKRKKAS